MTGKSYRIPRDYFNRVTPGLLEFVSRYPGQWEGKYESDTETVRFLYVGKYKPDNGVSFRMSRIALYESDFRDLLCTIINR